MLSLFQMKQILHPVVDSTPEDISVYWIHGQNIRKVPTEIRKNAIWIIYVMKWKS